MGKPPTSVTATIQFPGTTYRSVKESKSTRKRPRLLHGPRRVALFCLLGVFTPALLISIPLIMRFIVLGKYETVLSPSDMKILDKKISTFWCKHQTIRMNSTFTAYITEGEPELVQSTEPIVIQKNLIVPDDHKEYWGFYLLKGTQYRVSACAKFKGGTLLIVKGRNTLEHCAYIGNEDSNGNSDEFSASNSGSMEASVKHNNVTKSQEDMSLILRKIRHFVKSHPARYRKLKTNLFQLFTSNSNEEVLLETGNISLVANNRRRRREVQIVKNENAQAYAQINGHAQTGSHEQESNENGAYEVLDDEGEISSANHRPHHSGMFNQSTPNDGSNSESESSYSSSEEALAKCEGIIANLKIPHATSPETSCSSNNQNSSAFINFNSTVNSTGYYYFIFGSENEKTDNLLMSKIRLEKFEYRLPAPVPNCTGVKECRIELGFGSNQKILVSLPAPPTHKDGGLWDEVYFVQTDCEPRTNLYLVFILLVPIVLLMCAFQ